jgi:hypothetical protein
MGLADTFLNLLKSLISASYLFFFLRRRFLIVFTVT